MGVTIVDDRALAQRFAALEKGNATRMAHSAACRAVRRLPKHEGARLAAQHLELADLPGLQIGRLLLSIRSVGVLKAERWCVREPVCVRSLDRKVGELQERQRLTLARLLRVRADRWERGIR